jgi:imidazolonepropionase-like amidohydrolase
MRLAGVRLWDGTEDRGLVDITWQGDQITAVTAAEADLHAGLAVIPGLVDTHVHLINYAGAEPVHETAWALTTPPDEQLLHGAALARRAVRAGVTTLRDVGADIPPVALARAFDQGILDGPRLVVYGHVGMTAGHGDLIRPPAIRDRPETADGPEACRRLVRLNARRGVDGIKICTSGGVMSTGDRNEWRNHTRPELEALLDESHALGLRVAAHAHTTAGIQAALDAGVDTLEHATLITPRQAAQAVRQGVTVGPTLLILERVVAGMTGASAEGVAKGRALYEARGDAHRRAAEEGVRFVLATDAGGPSMPVGLEADEVRAMARQIGLTAEQALVAATSAAAAAIGRGDRVGRVAAGYGADLVLVRGEPWRSIDDLATDRIVAVVSRGRLVDVAPSRSPLLAD